MVIAHLVPCGLLKAESWTFSQRYASVQMMIWGFVGFIINLIYYTQFQTEKEEGDFIFGIATLIGAAIMVMICTEKALIRKFPKNTPEKE